MAEFIKPPKIDASTTQGQIKQLENYLFQLAQQLNYTFSEFENKGREK